MSEELKEASLIDIKILNSKRFASEFSKGFLDSRIFRILYLLRSSNFIFLVLPIGIWRVSKIY